MPIIPTLVFSKIKIFMCDPYLFSAVYRTNVPVFMDSPHTVGRSTTASPVFIRQNYIMTLMRLGGAVVTRLPLTATAWVRLDSKPHVGCLSPFTANAWWFFPQGFLTPQKCSKLLRLEPSHKADGLARTCSGWLGAGFTLSTGMNRALLSIFCKTNSAQ